MPSTRNQKSTATTSRVGGGGVGKAVKGIENMNAAKCTKALQRRSLSRTDKLALEARLRVLEAPATPPHDDASRLVVRLIVNATR